MPDISAFTVFLEPVTILGTNACTIVVNNVAHYTVSGQIIIYAISSTVI